MWAGFDISKATWEPAENVPAELIQEFEKTGPAGSVKSSKRLSARAARSLISQDLTTPARASLKPKRTPKSSRSKAQPKVVTSEKEYEVESIQASRQGATGKQYSVKWKGYKKPTWEPADNLSGCQDMLDAFEALPKQDESKDKKEAEAADASEAPVTPKRKRGRPSKKAEADAETEAEAEAEAAEPEAAAEEKTEAEDAPKRKRGRPASSKKSKSPPKKRARKANDKDVGDAAKSAAAESANAENPESGASAESAPAASKAAAVEKESKESKEDDDGPEDEVESIIGKKVTKGQIMYQVRWKSTPDESDWLPMSDLTNCHVLIEAYEQKSNQDQPKQRGRPRKTSS